MPETRSSSNDEKKEIKENRVFILDTPTKVNIDYFLTKSRKNHFIMQTIN